MIVGIGTDIVAIERIERLYERHGARALEKILSPEELLVCRDKTQPARYLAKRFAAKEALAKALGTGLRTPVLLTAMSVVNDELGKPFFTFADELSRFMEARALRVHLSISDERDNAIAFVVLEE